MNLFLVNLFWKGLFQYTPVIIENFKISLKFFNRVTSTRFACIPCESTAPPPIDQSERAIRFITIYGMSRVCWRGGGRESSFQTEGEEASCSSPVFTFFTVKNVIIFSVEWYKNISVIYKISYLQIWLVYIRQNTLLKFVIAVPVVVPHLGRVHCRRYFPQRFNCFFASFTCVNLVLVPAVCDICSFEGKL